MRGAWGGANPLEKALSNLVSGQESDTIKIPLFVSFYDLRWKFKGSEDSKPLSDCTKDELIEVLKALINHIQSMQNTVAIQRHREGALLELLK